MHYFQDYPDDEATEEKLIYEQVLASPKVALCHMFKWYREEKGKNFPGYNKKCNASRVKDFCQ